MKNIPLTQGKFAIVDDDSFEYLSQWKWCAIKSSKRFYAIRSVYRPYRYPLMVIMHRLILGVKDRKTQVDHIDRNGLHNWKGNLRIATHSENRRNEGLRDINSSGLKGVGWHKRIGKWQARLGFEYGRIHLGYFDDKWDAAKAYNEAASEHFGEFAWLNPIP